MLVELGSSLLVRLEFAQPVLGVGVVGHDRSEVVAVLASQVRKELATFTHGIEALGCFVDRVGEVASRGHDVVELCQHLVQSGGDVVEGTATVDRRKRRADRVPRTVVAAECVVGDCAGFSVGRSVGEHGFFCVERLVFVRIIDAGGIEFGHLEPEQVDLACAEPFVPAERGEGGVDLGQPGPSLAQRLEVDVAELVQRCTLRRHRQQALMGVLAVEVDHVGRDLGERRDRRRAAVDVGA